MFCPVTQCAIEIPPDRLMCVTHWRLVPRDLQATVWRTWRARLADSNLDTIRAHRQAGEDAVAHVENREPLEIR